MCIVCQLRWLSVVLCYICGVLHRVNMRRVRYLDAFHELVGDVRAVHQEPCAHPEQPNHGPLSQHHSTGCSAMHTSSHLILEHRQHHLQHTPAQRFVLLTATGIALNCMNYIMYRVATVHDTGSKGI